MQPLAAWMAIRSLTEHGSGKRRDLCDGLPFGDLGAEQLVSRDFFPGAPGKKSVITVAQNFQISTILFLHSLWSLILWAPGRGGNSGNAIITSYKAQRAQRKAELNQNLYFSAVSVHSVLKWFSVFKIRIFKIYSVLAHCNI